MPFGNVDVGLVTLLVDTFYILVSKGYYTDVDLIIDRLSSYYYLCPKSINKFKCYFLQSFKSREMT